MQIELIDTGYFYADGGAMFGPIPKTSWSKRYPSDEANGCKLAMRSVLVRTECGRIILIDTGAGNKQLKLLSYYRFFGLADDRRERHLTAISGEYRHRPRVWLRADRSGMSPGAEGSLSR